MIKLDKKKIIVLSSVLCVVLVGVLSFVFLGNKNTDNNSISSNIDRTKLLSGYANDTEGKIKGNIYQPFEESDITFNVYGEVGYNNLEGTILESVPMDIACTDEELQNIKSGNTNNEVLLNDEPTKVKNHCVIKLYRSSDASFIVSNDYAYILSAYIELPDGSLITFNSAKSKSIQINIYENETRVVLDGSSAYFRIVKQSEEKIFTVQVGDKIFETTGGTEFFAYSSTNTTAGIGYDNFFKGQVKDEIEFYKDLDGYNDLSKYLKNNYFVYNTASFQIVKGSGDILTRGTNSKLKKENGKYRFIYYPNYIIDDAKEGGYLVTNPNDQRFNSLGTHTTEADELDSHKDFYLFLENQKAINKLSYGFDNIIVNKIDINKSMKDYLSKFKSIAKQKLVDYNASKPKDDSPCSYSYLLTLFDNCGCKKDWYFIPHVGCCPNGYTFSTTKNQCIKTIIVSSCPSGTYNVGNDKCCPNGSTISSNGLSCIYSSTNKKSIPTYYPNSNNNATKTPTPNIDTNDNSGCIDPPMEAECGPKDEKGCAFYGMEEKNGQCCIDLVCVKY